MDRLERSLWIFDIGFRRMNADLPAGWMAHMGVFSALGIAMIVFLQFGLPLAWPLAVIGSLDLFATQHFLRWSLPRIRRLGPLGPTRARWWIEVAALVWTMCISIGVFAATHALPGAVVPARNLFCLFFAVSGIGFILGLVQGKRIRGRALELVAWFFWISVALGASMVLIPDDPVLTDWVAPALAIFSLVVLIGAGLIALKHRRDIGPRLP